MARNTSFNRYDQDTFRSYDEEPNDSEFVEYEPAPPMEDDYALPEEPMPLFLSQGDEEQPRQRRFGAGGDVLQEKSLFWPRIFKGSVVVAVLAGIAFAVLTVGNPLALFADAKASLPNAGGDQTGTVQAAAPQPATPTQSANAGPTPVLPSTSGVRATPPTQQRVTRDDIALALRSAQPNQGQAQPDPAPPAVVAAVTPVTAPVTQAAPPAPVAQAAAPTPARKIDADELAMLMSRAKGLIAIGDIASARLLLERAADAQEATAALLLAQTYDPAVLGTQDMRSITPDPAMAREWYQKAARLGSTDARQRLAQMQN